MGAVDALNGAIEDIYSAMLDPVDGRVCVCNALASASKSTGAAIVPWQYQSRFDGSPTSQSIVPLLSDYRKDAWYLRDTRDSRRSKLVNRLVTLKAPTDSNTVNTDRERPPPTPNGRGQRKQSIKNRAQLSSVSKVSQVDSARLYHGT